MGVKEWIGGVGLIILFVISMLYFMTSFIQTNNPEGFGNDVAGLNSTIANFSARAEQLQAVGNNVKHTLESEQPSPIFLFLIIYSAFSIPIAFISFLISGAFAVVTLTFTSLFGAGDTNPFYIVFAVVNGLVMIGIVLAVLKAIRLGQTER